MHNCLMVKHICYTLGPVINAKILLEKEEEEKLINLFELNAKCESNFLSTMRHFVVLCP